MSIGLRFLVYLIPAMIAICSAFGYWLYTDISSQSSTSEFSITTRHLLLSASFFLSMVLLVSIIFGRVVLNGINSIIGELTGRSDVVAPGSISETTSHDEFRKIAEMIASIEESNEQNIGRINSLLNHDELTSLPNRVSLNRAISNAISSYSVGGPSFALMLINIVSFKKLNDRHGLLFGDSLIMAVSSRLSSVIGSDYFSGYSTSVYRMLGDEFMVMLSGDIDHDKVDRAAIHITSQLSEPFYVHMQEQQISVNIGISIFPDHGDDKYELLKFSDLALNEAKLSSDKSHVFFNQVILDKLRYESNMEAKILQAIENDEFDVFYQPKVLLENGSVQEFEALIRWNSADEGFISPGIFIPFAEKRGLIDKIGNWVIRRVMRDIKTLYDDGVNDFKMSINISPKQLDDFMSDDYLLKSLSDYNVKPTNVEIEITEHSFADNIKSVIAYLSKLRDFGITISVDDFGTGYSSLSYLQNLPIDTLKIDKSFITDVQNKPSQEAIVMTIIRLAKGLGLYTVAEGVETESELKFVSEMGCDLVQGYYFYKPMPFSEIRKILNK